MHSNGRLTREQAASLRFLANMTAARRNMIFHDRDTRYWQGQYWAFQFFTKQLAQFFTQQNKLRNENETRV